MMRVLPTSRDAASGSTSTWCCRRFKTALLLAGCCVPVAPGIAQVMPPTTPGPTCPLATKLTTLKVGDDWIYEQSGTMTVPTSGSTAAATLPLSGMFVEDVERRTFQRQPTLALVVKQNLTIGGVSIYGNNPAPEQIFYVEQDPKTNDVLVLGDNATPTGTAEVADTRIRADRQVFAETALGRQGCATLPHRRSPCSDGLSTGPTPTRRTMIADAFPETNS